MKSIPSLFNTSVQLFGNNPLMYQYGTNCYEPLTYQEMHTLVNRFANGLLALGLQKGDKVTLISEGRNDWVMAELAVLFTGGINVPVSVRVDEPEDLAFRINHSESVMVIASGRHSRKILALGDRIPGVKNIIILDKTDDTDSRVVFRDDLMALGERHAEENPGLLEGISQAIQENDVANICYTSGTTADPKGILLTHKNYYVNVEQAGGLFEIPEYYTSLLILPWDHSFAHTCGIYALMKNGASMAAVNPGKNALEAVKNIPSNIREIKPYFLLSVPALAKNFRKNIEKGIEAKGKTLKIIFDYGLRLSVELHGNGFNPTTVKHRWLKKGLYRLISNVIYKKIREQFGGRLRFFVGGGALLDTDLQHFFFAIGIPMFQGYGLTEAAPIISSNSPDCFKFGSSGRIVEHLEVRILDPEGNGVPTGAKGEIVVRGENVMIGYWKNEIATKEALKDGWLYTGDMGYRDEDGFLYVLGRFKSLLIAGDGEKYSPEGIEEAIIEKCPSIDQVMLINNQHPYTSMLLVPNKQACKAAMAASGEDGDKALNHAIKTIKEELDRFREGGEFGDLFPQRWLPSAVAILEQEFNDQNHMVNSTMKIVRGKIAEHYTGRIESMYTPEGKEFFNTANIQALKQYLAV
jgi:long-chain acyl-CoA synthetase